MHLLLGYKIHIDGRGKTNFLNSCSLTGIKMTQSWAQGKLGSASEMGINGSLVAVGSFGRMKLS